MEPLTAFLFSMQAAGLVTSLFSNRSQEKYINIGRKLEQEQFTTNLEAIRLQSAESSLDEMKQLRSNIGSQIVMNAARGNRGGTSYLGINEATKSFQNDERKRRLNLMTQESQLRAGNVLSGLHTFQSETALGQSLAKQFLDTVPVSSLLSDAFGKRKNPSTSNPETGFSWGF